MKYEYSDADGILDTFLFECEALIKEIGKDPEDLSDDNIKTIWNAWEKAAPGLGIDEDDLLDLLFSDLSGNWKIEKIQDLISSDNSTRYYNSIEFDYE